VCTKTGEKNQVPPLTIKKMSATALHCMDSLVLWLNACAFSYASGGTLRLKIGRFDETCVAIIVRLRRWIFVIVNRRLLFWQEPIVGVDPSGSQYRAAIRFFDRNIRRRAVGRSLSAVIVFTIRRLDPAALRLSGTNYRTAGIIVCVGYSSVVVFLSVGLRHHGHGKRCSHRRLKTDENNFQVYFYLCM